jgi:hypothetical protein
MRDEKRLIATKPGELSQQTEVVKMVTWMKAWVGTLIRDERAQDLAEYGIALAVIGIGAAAAAIAIAVNVNQLWTTASSIIATAV